MKKAFLPLKKAVLSALLVLLLCMAGVTNALAQTFTEGNLNYSINEDGASVTVTGHVDGTSATGELVIPESVELYGTTYPVTVIGNEAFKNHYGLTGSLVIPNSVITIGQGAFYHCHGITGTLTLGDAVRSIGVDAFSECTGFTGSLTIGNAVRTIGNYAFHNCSGFTGSLTIGNTVQTINQNAFSGCTGFTGSLTIGDAVQTIGSYAFYNCSGFTGSLTITESVIQINEYAFSNCNFTSLNYNAASCNSINTTWLYNTPFLTILNIGENVHGIPENFLKDNSSFSSELVIPNSVVYIGNAAFENCTGFTGSLSIPNSVTTMGNNVFMGCTGFTGSLTIGNSMTTIGNNAFMGCTGFTGSLTIGNSVTSIGGNAFNGCSGFTGSLKIPNSVITIGISAFNGCSGFTGAPTIGNSVTSIGENAFNGCSGFTGSLTIPNAVTTIGNSAFMNCTGFSGTLTLGQSLTVIDNSAFFGACEGFTAFNVLAEVPPTLGSNVFLSVNTGIPIHVTCGTLEAYQNAEGWNIFTNIQESDPCQWSIAAVANPTMGGTIGGSGIYEQGQTCTLVAVPNEGYSFVNWTEDGEEISTDAEYAFTVTTNRLLKANFHNDKTVVIGEGTGTNQYLPSYSYYNYSLTQQIYTAEEIGQMGAINRVAFFNGGATKTRIYDIYLAHTEKTSFDNANDWIAVSEADKVFSGVVTMYSNMWMTITLDTPFVFNGTSNLVLIVDDNTGSWTSSPHMACRVFGTGSSQAIRVYSDDTDYDPYEPAPYNGTRYSEKNQIILDFSFTVFATISPMGAGSVTGTGAYEIGDTCTLVATPSSDAFAFVNWTENGEVVSTDAQYTFTVTGNHHLVANFIQVIFDITATADPEEGGTISGTGSYEEGQTCTLTATANEDYAFVKWTENDEEVSNEASYAFTVTGNRNLVAHFRYIRYEITASANPEEGGTISGTGSYQEGQTCTLTATPSEGYVFVNWTENGEEVSTEASYAFTVTGDRNLVANFTLATYTITATANPTEGGRVIFVNTPESGQYSFEDGTMQGWTTIDADWDGRNWFHSMNHPRYDYTGRGHNGTNGFVVSASYQDYYGAFSANNYLVSPQRFSIVPSTFISFWADYGSDSYPDYFEVCVATADNPAPADFTKVWGGNAKNASSTKAELRHNDNHRYNNWREHIVDLSAYAGQEVWIAFHHQDYDMYEIWIDDITISIPDTVCTANYVHGSTCAVTASPNYGYAFENWTENGNVVSTDTEFSFTVTSDRDLVANFTKVPFTINATPNYDDRGTVNGAGEYVIDATCTLTAIPTEGHNFVHWTENGEVVSTEASYTFTVAGPRDLVAVFTAPIADVIVFADPNVKAICASYWDTDGDTELTYAEAAAVTDLGYVFYNHQDITSFDELQYFTGLTFLNGYEFHGCENLASIIIPTSVTSIGYNAFAYCYNLTTVTIPEFVTYIDYNVFYNSGLTTLNYNATNCSVYGWLNYCSLTNLTIGDNVQVIPDSFVSEQSNLVGELVIPESVTYIGSNAFYDCSSLTSITIPEGITSIEEGTFYWCSSLESINLPNTVETIGNWAFTGCSSLTDLVLPSSLTYIGYEAFGNCSSLTGTLELPASLETIGYEAFYNCVGFESIIMSENIHSIGNRAFRNCSGLRGELTLPESLESVGGYAFYGCDGISTVNYNATNCQTMGDAGEPVFYDCAFEHIRIGENVQSIPNYAFKRCFLVTDIASGAVNPPTIYSSTFGMVPRSIPVSVPIGSGEAYRNAPYWEEFFNINEDYSPSPYSYHWTVNPHQFAGNMTVTGIIQIEGVEQAIPSLEIGAFCNGECRGRQLLTYYPQVDRYLVFLMLYGEDGDVFNFRLFDHGAGQELTAGCTSVIAFETDATIGSFSNPYVFNFTNVQVSEFTEGWSWWSTYIEMAGIDGLSMLESGLGTNGLVIKSQSDGYTEYYDDYDLWYGSLNAINNESSYMVKTSVPCTVTMPGTTALPSQHPITVDANGWTWIGYPVAHDMDINAALEGLASLEGDVLKSQEGYAEFYEGYGWFGSLATFSPGRGYMYKSTSASPATFTYPSGSRGDATNANLSANDNHWMPAVSAYPFNMTVTAVVELDGEELRSDRYELAAFANGESRGSVRLMYVEPIDRYVAFLTIAGEEAADLSFSLYDMETGMECLSANEAIAFEANATVGRLAEPFVVSFRGTTGMDELANSLRVYPNPVNPGERFSIGLNTESKAPVRVEIVNALGVTVSVETSTQTPASIKAPEVAGIYTMRVIVDGKGMCCRKLVVK